MAGATAVFAEYSPDIVAIVIDPVRGLPRKCKFLPSLAEIRAECEDYCRPIRERAEWDRRAKAQLDERDLIESQYEQSTAKRYTYREFIDGAAEGKWPSVPKGYFEP